MTSATFRATIAQLAALNGVAQFIDGTRGLVPVVPLVTVRGEWITDLLRISVDENGETKWLRLEGRVTGPWAAEFERAWNEIAPALNSRKFGVDLRGVTHMDVQARKLLAEIYRTTAAEFLANSPITKFFAEEARRASERKQQEE